MLTIRVPKWFVWLFIPSLILLMSWPAMSRTQRMPIPIGLVIRDGNNRPLRTSNITISVFRLGTRAAPQSQWVRVDGKLDSEGYLRTTAAVPVESSLIPLVEQLLR